MALRRSPCVTAALLASCIMHRRTTVSAPSEALDTLEAEARRRGVSLTTVLAEAVSEKAAALRAARRPRLGLGASTDGRSAAELAGEPVAHPPKS
jgi:hypothetical protein